MRPPADDCWKDRLLSPAHDWTAPWVARLPEHYPHCADLNRLLDPALHVAGSGQPICFAPAGAAPTQGYEARIHDSGAVPTREGNWHDLFNALAWIAFPASKRALNQLHCRHAADDPPGRRSAARDVLTLFDESGVIVVCADAELTALLTRFRWKELFWSQRARVRRSMRFVVFGHALQEQALAPHPGITGKALICPAALDDLEGLDAWLAAQLARPQTLAGTRVLAPLPLMGIPGWDAASEAAQYYDNTAVFRPGRRVARGSTV